MFMSAPGLGNKYRRSDLKLVDAVLAGRVEDVRSELERETKKPAAVDKLKEKFALISKSQGGAPITPWVTIDGVRKEIKSVEDLDSIYTVPEGKGYEDYRKRHALHWVAFSNASPTVRMEIAQLLINADFTDHLRDQDNRTALEWASFKQDYHLVCFLLQQKHPQIYSGESGALNISMGHAGKNGHISTLLALYAAGGDPSCALDKVDITSTNVSFEQNLATVQAVCYPVETMKELASKARGKDAKASDTKSESRELKAFETPTEKSLTRLFSYALANIGKTTSVAKLWLILIFAGADRNRALQLVTTALNTLLAQKSAPDKRRKEWLLALITFVCNPDKANELNGFNLTRVNVREYFTQISPETLKAASEAVGRAGDHRAVEHLAYAGADVNDILDVVVTALDTAPADQAPALLTERLELIKKISTLAQERTSITLRDQLIEKAMEVAGKLGSVEMIKAIIGCGGLAANLSRTLKGILDTLRTSEGNNYKKLRPAINLVLTKKETLSKAILQEAVELAAQLNNTELLTKLQGAGGFSEDALLATFESKGKVSNSQRLKTIKQLMAGSTTKEHKAGDVKAEDEGDEQSAAREIQSFSDNKIKKLAFEAARQGQYDLVLYLLGLKPQLLAATEEKGKTLTYVMLANPKMDDSTAVWFLKQFNKVLQKNQMSRLPTTHPITYGVNHFSLSDNSTYENELGCAARRNWPKLCKYLIQKQNAQINLWHDAKEAGDTALLAAVKAYALDSTAVLCKAGSEVSVKDAKGDTPLVIAARGGKAALVEEILKHVGSNFTPAEMLAAFAAFFTSLKDKDKDKELSDYGKAANFRETFKKMLSSPAFINIVVKLGGWDKFCQTTIQGQSSDSDTVLKLIAQCLLRDKESITDYFKEAETNFRKESPILSAERLRMEGVLKDVGIELKRQRDAFKASGTPAPSLESTKLLPAEQELLRLVYVLTNPESSADTKPNDSWNKDMADRIKALGERVREAKKAEESELRKKAAVIVEYVKQLLNTESTGSGSSLSKLNPQLMASAVLAVLTVDANTKAGQVNNEPFETQAPNTYNLLRLLNAKHFRDPGVTRIGVKPTGFLLKMHLKDDTRPTILWFLKEFAKEKTVSQTLIKEIEQWLFQYLGLVATQLRLAGQQYKGKGKVDDYLYYVCMKYLLENTADPMAPHKIAQRVGYCVELLRLVLNQPRPKNQLEHVTVVDTLTLAVDKTTAVQSKHLAVIAKNDVYANLCEGLLDVSQSSKTQTSVAAETKEAKGSDINYQKAKLVHAKLVVEAPDGIKLIDARFPDFWKLLATQLEYVVENDQEEDQELEVEEEQEPVFSLSEFRESVQDQGQDTEFKDSKDAKAAARTLSSNSVTSSAPKYSSASVSQALKALATQSGSVLSSQEIKDLPGTTDSAVSNVTTSSAQDALAAGHYGSVTSASASSASMASRSYSVTSTSASKQSDAHASSTNGNGKTATTSGNGTVQQPQPRVLPAHLNQYR